MEYFFTDWRDDPTMRPPVRFGAAVLAGLLAAAVAFVAARPVVDGTQATAVAAANAAVWTGAAAVYLRVYGRFGGAPAASGDVDQYVQLKWGGMGGVVGSLGIAGPAVLLADVAPMRYAGALAGRRVIRLLAGDPVADTVAEVPGGERTLLPVPGCDCGADPGDALPREGEERSLSEAVDRAERAVDPRVGPLSEVGEQESFPVPYYVARVADTTQFSDARAAEFGGGVDAGWDAAFMKALGEGLERYAAGIYREESFTRAPAANVSNPVTPDAFVRPESSESYARDDRLPWVTGEGLGTGEAASLPAEFVHFPPPEKRYRPSITTGLGLGNSGPHAALSGLYEVVERDATMTSWYSTVDPLGIDVDDEGFAELAKRARAESLAVTPLLVTADVDVPVVAVGVHREGDWPRFAAGSGADLDPAAAARSALAEALQNWTELRSMGRETAAEQGAAIGRHADFPAETQTFFDPETTVPAASIGEETASGAAELSALVERVEAVGLDPYVARVTTRDLAALGFEAVRVLVPGAQPLFTGEPFFGDRASEVPRSMGFEPALDNEYHPFP